MDINDFGIGVDTEEIQRFEKYSQDKDNTFLKRVYTDNEIEYSFQGSSPAKHLAVRFCAKEAVYKAFCSVGITSLIYKDIEVVNDSNKVPVIVIDKKETAGYTCKISLSHSKDTAVASAIVIKQ